MEAGKIILINGASSSGKTRILRAIQNSVGEVYLECGIDKFIWMHPERYLEHSEGLRKMPIML
jgi:chloramphenicol 3-O-phosphotransferase